MLPRRPLQSRKAHGAARRRQAARLADRARRLSKGAIAEHPRPAEPILRAAASASCLNEGRLAPLTIAGQSKPGEAHEQHRPGRRLWHRRHRESVPKYRAVWDPALAARVTLILNNAQGLNGAEHSRGCGGACRVRETPLLNTSDKSSVPVPVVVPAKVANASVARRP